MTRNIQCREMIDDVQRQMAGVSFSGNSATYSPSPATPHHHSHTALPPQHHHSQTVAPPQHHYYQHPPSQQPYHTAGPPQNNPKNFPPQNNPTSFRPRIRRSLSDPKRVKRELERVFCAMALKCCPEITDSSRKRTEMYLC